MIRNKTLQKPSIGGQNSRLGDGYGSELRAIVTVEQKTEGLAIILPDNLPLEQANNILAIINAQIAKSGVTGEAALKEDLPTDIKNIEIFSTFNRCWEDMVKAKKIGPHAKRYKVRDDLSVHGIGEVIFNDNAGNRQTMVVRCKQRAPQKK
jgi:hypothetical protein